MANTTLSTFSKTNKIVYVYDPGWGVANATFGLGSDSTGDGEALTPYATVNEAVNQINIYDTDPDELNLNTHSGNWIIRIISEDGESNLYPNNILMHTGLAQARTTQPNQKVNFQGWKKSWGDLAWGAVGKWTQLDGSDKPTISGYLYVQATSDNIQHMHLKDIVFTYTQGTNNSFMINGNVYQDSYPAFGKWVFFGCVFNGPRGPYNNKSTGSRYAGFLACIIKPWAYSNSWVVTNSTLYNLDRCFVNGGANNAVYQYGSTSSQYMRAINSIVVSDGGTAHYAYLGTNAYNEFNRYHLLNGAKFMNDDATIYDHIGDIPQSFLDYGFNFCTEGDPDILSLDAPKPNNGSPVLGRGGQWAGGLSYYNNSSEDLDNGKDWGQYDFVNELWSPGQEDKNYVYPNGTNSYFGYTHKAVGPYQVAEQAAPQKSIVKYPEGNTPEIPQYIVVSAPKSAQDPVSGKTHVQITLADGGNPTQGIQKFDSCPITIDSTNKYIDFKEDGGSELTATLTEGTYSTAGLLAEIKTQMEAVGSGTYTPSFDSATEKFSSAVGGAVTTHQILINSGTNAANSYRRVVGLRNVDTADAATIIADDTTKENFWDPLIEWKAASDYTSGDPGSVGTWTTDLGTAEPPTGGAPGDGTYDIRADIPQHYAIDGKAARSDAWSGGYVPRDDPDYS